VSGLRVASFGLRPLRPLQISWASLRACVEPAVGERITWSHEQHLKGQARVLVGTVQAVSKNSIQLSTGNSVPFDYLVLAPGNAATVGKPIHKTLAERRAFFRAEAERLSKANSVLIIGGGPVGVELATEIVTDMPGKKVTLVHAGSTLMDQGMARDAFAGKFSVRLTDMVKKAGVEVMLNTRMKRSPSGAFDHETESGVNVQADIVYDCTGSRPATGFLHDSPVKLTAAGYIVVDKTLLVTGTQNIFALGDAAETGYMKQGFSARSQAALVVRNVLASMRKQPLKLLGPPMVAIFVSLGRNSGLGQLPLCGGLVVGPGVVASAKSKKLFIDKVRQQHGV